MYNNTIDSTMVTTQIQQAHTTLSKPTVDLISLIYVGQLDLVYTTLSAKYSYVRTLYNASEFRLKKQLDLIILPHGNKSLTASEFFENRNPTRQQFVINYLW